jgi:hypothetical protein
MNLGKPARVQDTKLMDEVRNQPCIITGSREVDVHHVKSRGSHGDDVEWNLAPLTRALHTEFHKIGMVTFAKKYPLFEIWLISKGWTFDEFRQRWMHPVK